MKPQFHYNKSAVFLLAIAVIASSVSHSSAFFRKGSKDDLQAEPPFSGLSEERSVPIAKNIDLSTYKNVPSEGIFDAYSTDGTPLTFRITSTPARGRVELNDAGSGRFTYIPYENKTGKDSFLYIAVTADGRQSKQAKVKITITKPETKVIYQDMDGNPAQKAAIRLAEENVYVGASMNGKYYFQPGLPVGRGEFLAMAMKVGQMEPLAGITQTGFDDDAAIPTWCKGYVSSALMAGAVCGSPNEKGKPEFRCADAITYGQAAAMLNEILHISDAPQETVSRMPSQHWASQAAANLISAGIEIDASEAADSMNTALTRQEAAILLDGALDISKIRAQDTLFRL